MSPHKHEARFLHRLHIQPVWDMPAHMSVQHRADGRVMHLIPVMSPEHPAVWVKGWRHNLASNNRNVLRQARVEGGAQQLDRTGLGGYCVLLLCPSLLVLRPSLLLAHAQQKRPVKSEAGRRSLCMYASIGSAVH